MPERVKNLHENWGKRSAEAKEKALEAIRLMQAEQAPVNFHSVHARSGLSKNYLYKEAEIRNRIEEIRAAETQSERIRHQRYDKTTKSKEVIIEAKDRRIAKLEEENRKLRLEMELLRGMLYDKR